MFAIIGLVLGAAAAFVFPYYVSAQYSTYLAVAILAALDTLAGGFRASVKKEFDFRIFATGFVFNTLLAAGLTYLGDLLGVDIYLAAVVVFGARLFQNVGEIRRFATKRKSHKEKPADIAENS